MLTQMQILKISAYNANKEVKTHNEEFQQAYMEALQTFAIILVRDGIMPALRYLEQKEKESTKALFLFKKNLGKAMSDMALITENQEVLQWAMHADFRLLTKAKDIADEYIRYLGESLNDQF